MNTLYKIGDLKYNGKYSMKVWRKVGYGPNLPRLKWPNLPLTDYFQISRDSSFQDAGEKLIIFYIEAHYPFVIKI